MTMRTFRSELIPGLNSAILRWDQIPKSSLVDLEIGAGAGLHAIQYAQQNPKRTIIAIERTTKIEKLNSRLKSHPNIENLFSVRADAIHWCAQNVPPLSLDRVFILYPNPYPKQSQRNHRWAFMPFMGFLIGRMKLKGHLELATNDFVYAQEAKEQFENVWKLKVLEFCKVPTHSKPRTHFEKKYLARNEPCWNLLLTKNL